MNTNILVSSKERKAKRFVIGTHDGVFHSDEVVACAILTLFHSSEVIEIVRSKEVSYLVEKGADIFVDVGGGRYDHHQPGGNGRRDNDVAYASAGLVWREFGKELVHKCSCKLYGNSTDYIVTSVFNEIDEKIIQEVDKEDNGIATSLHTFSFIPSFLPVYDSSYYGFDESFHLALNSTINILEHVIFTSIARFKAKNDISEIIINNGINEHVLEIPSQTFPWLEPVILHNNTFSENHLHIYFVIFPYPSGGWAAQCVPPSLEKKFEQIIPFPKAWAGKTNTDLAEISGVKDATFCHNGCFFVRAKTILGIIDLCRKACLMHRLHL